MRVPLLLSILAAIPAPAADYKVTDPEGRVRYYVGDRGSERVIRAPDGKILGYADEQRVTAPDGRTLQYLNETDRSRPLSRKMN